VLIGHTVVKLVNPEELKLELEREQKVTHISKGYYSQLLWLVGMLCEINIVGMLCEINIVGMLCEINNC